MAGLIKQARAACRRDTMFRRCLSFRSTKAVSLSIRPVLHHCYNPLTYNPSGTSPATKTYFFCGVKLGARCGSRLKDQEFRGAPVGRYPGRRFASAPLRQRRRDCLGGDRRTLQPAHLQHLLPFCRLFRRRSGSDPGSLHQGLPHAFFLRL